MVISMTAIIKKDVNKFVKELKKHYSDVWKIPSSRYLDNPDFIVVDPRTGKKVKISFVALDDGETVSIVYDDLS